MSKGFKLDKSKLMQAAAVEVQSFVRDNFRSESFGGQKWKPRKEYKATTARAVNVSSKEKKKKRRKKVVLRYRRLLTLTRRLERGLRTIKRGSVVILVSDVNYSVYHNEGTDVIPARPFFKDTPELRKRLEKALIASMKRQLKA
jgi:phage gpG-like protein